MATNGYRWVFVNGVYFTLGLQMRSSFLFILFSILLAGCASSNEVLYKAPIDFSLKPISIQEAFREAEVYPITQGTKITIATGQTSLVNLGGENLFVIPINNDGSRKHTIKVKSYAARKNNGAYILFYPVLTFVDENFQAYLTVNPKNEFALHQNVLTNEFEIPAGIYRILIHTDQEHFRDSPEGKGSAWNNPSGSAYGIAGLLGGAIGGLILHEVSQGAEKPFKFDKVGVVSVETN